MSLLLQIFFRNGPVRLHTLQPRVLDDDRFQLYPGKELSMNGLIDARFYAKNKKIAHQHTLDEAKKSGIHGITFIGYRLLAFWLYIPGSFVEILGECCIQKEPHNIYKNTVILTTQQYFFRRCAP
jgi:hypothetical protein